jgi:hypothetical protein
MRPRRLDNSTRFVRHCRLGTEAVYEIVEVNGNLVTAEVVSAPGLQPGQRIRLMAKAIRAMERVERPEPSGAVASRVALRPAVSGH